MPVLAIEHSDFQDVQVINDRMNAAKYIVGSNVDICSKMKAKLLNDQGTDLFLDEFRLQSRRVESLLERAKSGSSLVRNGSTCQLVENSTDTFDRCKTSYLSEA